MPGEKDSLETFWKAVNENAQEVLSSLQAFWQLDGGRDCKAGVTFSVNRDLIPTFFFYLALHPCFQLSDFKVKQFWFNFTKKRAHILL